MSDELLDPIQNANSYYTLRCSAKHDSHVFTLKCDAEHDSQMFTNTTKA